MAAARANKAQQMTGLANRAGQLQGQGAQIGQNLATQQALPAASAAEQIQQSTMGNFQNQLGQTPNMQKQSNIQGANGASRVALPQQQAAATQMPRSNLKRYNSDEVIEVPNPNQNQALQSQQPPQGTGQPQRPNLPRITAEQMAKMTPEQRQQFIMLQNRNRSIPQNPKDQAQFVRFKQLLSEEAAAFAARPLQPVNMSEATRSEMVQKLTDKKNRDMFSRIEGLMLQYHKLTGDEEATRELIRQVSPHPSILPCSSESHSIIFVY